MLTIAIFQVLPSVRRRKKDPMALLPIVRLIQ